MALFLPIVLEKELKNLDNAKVRTLFETLKSKFRKSVQNRIAGASEIALQGEFVEKFFEDTLGYSRFPDDGWHIIREQNSEASNERADAAIVRHSDTDKQDIIGIIELKGTDTHDLKSVEQQVFKYFRQHPNCRYAITSNYQSVRLYIDDNKDYEEFNLFDLVNNDDYERFRLLYCYLHKDAVLGDKTQELRALTISKEKEITESLYKLYKNFRIVLFEDLKKQNKSLNEFVVYQKTQKLLDRFLFILFAEDKDLLPRFTIRTHIENWQMGARKTTVLQVFQALFQELNTGNKAKNIFAYNGGLFDPDAVIDNLKLPIGNILELNLLELEAYDYKTQVDVSILGHIFEQSLNDLDEMKALASGETVDKNKTKRKKDGVFYTPQYITRYIIENTLGALCSEKRHELGIFVGKKTNEAALLAYRDWLNTVTVLDPACGSGAFLSEVLTFFVQEHEAVAERIAGATSKPVIYKDYALDILENNIFGVDLNEEAVEIAKLSLWLRTAKQGRKLSDLSKNIKTGNSLVDDPTISDKAFDWKREFPQVFASVSGGFDVVVGNPPYGVSFDTKTKAYLLKYDELTPDYEIYYYFITKGIDLLRVGGRIAYIFPNTFLSNSYAKKFRNRLLETVHIESISDLSDDKTFVDASVRTCILALNKMKNMDEKSTVLRQLVALKADTVGVTNSVEISATNLYEALDNWLTLLSSDILTYKTVQKIRQKSTALNVYCEVSQGYIPYRRSDLVKKYGAYGDRIVDERLWHASTALSTDYKQEILGKNVGRYWNSETESYIKYTTEIASYVNPRFFEQTRILVREICEKSLFCTLLDKPFYNNPSIINVIAKDKKVDLYYLLGIINSKLVGWYHYNTSPKAKKGLFPKILVNDVRNLPIVIAEKQKSMIDLVQKMLTTNQKIETLRTDYVAHLQVIFGTNLGLNKKINDFHSDTWQALSAELRKQKLTLLPKQETATKAEFEKVQALIKGLQVILKRTDAEIDAQVYKLYDLTPEEIEMVERS